MTLFPHLVSSLKLLQQTGELREPLLEAYSGRNTFAFPFSFCKMGKPNLRLNQNHFRWSCTPRSLKKSIRWKTIETGVTYGGKPQNQTEVCAVVVPVGLRCAQCLVLHSSKPAEKLLRSALRHTATPGISQFRFGCPDLCQRYKKNKGLKFIGNDRVRNKNKPWRTQVR